MPVTPGEAAAAEFLLDLLLVLLVAAGLGAAIALPLRLVRARRAPRRLGAG